MPSGSLGSMTAPEVRRLLEGAGLTWLARMFLVLAISLWMACFSRGRTRGDLDSSKYRGDRPPSAAPLPCACYCGQAPVPALKGSHLGTEHTHSLQEEALRQ